MSLPAVTSRAAALSTTLEAIGSRHPARAITFWEQSSPDDRRALFGSLIAGLVESEPGTGTALVRSALADPAAVPGPSETVAAALADVDPALAQDVASRTAEPERALAEIAVARANSDPDWAVRTAAGILDARLRDETRSRLVDRLIPEHLEQALACARETADGYSRETALARIAVAFAVDRYKIDQALTVLAELPGGGWARRDAGVQVALAVAEIDPARALELLRGFQNSDDPDTRSLPLLLAEDRERTLALASELSDSWRRDEAYAVLAEALRPAEPDRAALLAQSIQGAPARAGALVDFIMSTGQPHLLVGVLDAGRGDPDFLLAAAARLLRHPRTPAMISQAIAAGVAEALRAERFAGESVIQAVESARGLDPGRP